MTGQCLHLMLNRSALQATCLVLALAVAAGRSSGQTTYAWVQDTNNSGAWDDPAMWTGGPAGTFPNGVGVTAVITAPTKIAPAPAGNYNLAMPASDVTLSEFKIDNTNHANSFRSNFNNGGDAFRLIFESSSGPARYTETIGSAPGATNSQYRLLSKIRINSDLIMTQDNYPNLNTGTILGNLVEGAANRTITKEGHGGIQFEYNHLPGETPFQGQVVLNQGGIRLISVNPFINVSGIDVNSGGQLMLADNANNNANTDWNLATGAVLNLNGPGKATDSPQSVINPEGALRFSLGQVTASAFHNPVVLQSDAVISVSVAALTGTLSGVVSGPGGLTKHGDGALVLSNAGSSYGGDTRVLPAPTAPAVSTLSFTNPILPDGRDVYLSETGTALNLNFSGADTVRSLFVDGAPQPVGTYGASDNLSVPEAFRKSFITGGGLLEVTTFPLLEDADFNNDDFIDGADFLIWQQNFGGSGGLAEGDANGDTLINDQDLAIWREQFGGAGSAAAGAAVPEPATLATLLMALASMVAVRRRRPWREGS
jgi:autotransporter-associated beta strand protein